MAFKVGDKVYKAGGSYQARGTIIGVAETSLGKVLYVFEFDQLPGMVHLFAEDQLELIIVDERPHSRACGAAPHHHGVSCHPNCPTCGQSRSSLYMWPSKEEEGA